MRRWQWWLVGLAVLGGLAALAIVFWPKMVECMERCNSSRRTRGGRPDEIETADAID